MQLERQEIETRILDILAYINDKKLADPMKKNMALFTEVELSQILGFLETGSYDSIYRFLEEKYKEFSLLVEETKHLKIGDKMNSFKAIEKEEREKEKGELENILIS